MTKQSKVTKIEKKYKDKKTGEYKSMTIEYSKVADRIKEFRQDCPFGETKTNIDIKGEYMFVNAYVQKDKSNPTSASSTGNIIKKITGEDKEFEKAETLAVGRALAFLGYGASGEIASSEEMEEFLSFRERKEIEDFENFKDIVDGINNVDELRELYKKSTGRGKEYDKYIINKVNSIKNGK